MIPLPIAPQALPARALLIACAALALPAAAADLAVGQPAQGLLAPGQTLRWQVQVPPGHVAQGDFDGPGAVLDVVGADGRHLRRLAGAESSPQGFTWQVQPGQQLQVRAGPLAGPYALHLRRALAPATDAPASAAPPESPRLRALARTLTEGGTNAAEAIAAF